MNAILSINVKKKQNKNIDGGLACYFQGTAHKVTELLTGKLGRDRVILSHPVTSIKQVQVIFLNYVLDRWIPHFLNGFPAVLLTRRIHCWIFMIQVQGSCAL